VHYFEKERNRGKNDLLKDWIGVVRKLVFNDLHLKEYR
jgi:hypothetical protein